MQATVRYKDKYCNNLTYHAFAYGFEVGCRPMPFLDKTHIKQHRVQGVILAASALNGNNEIFSVAYSIVDSETYDNLVWFLQNLKKALLSDRRIAFLSDMGKGLKEAIPDIFPNDHYGYCFQHIMQNFNDQCAGKYTAPFKKLLRKILQRISYAVIEQEYQDAMMAMELNSTDAKEWGRVEELLVAEELWNDHKKLIFFPFSSAATCTNRPLELDQRRSS
ncbi:hypothetical protein Taro_031161 [Colocasia esculenta]|uniref:MULE transposase domain-containing protein n=1 Tax=Colocasia esculenta TaxID=4460 RepID=A0A843VTX6_COLES|nr:hypothetical protein [Colocasia esculenta]